MRDIKFRGKSTETKLHTAQWRFGSLLTSPNEACKPLIYQRFSRPMHDGNGYWYEVEAETVGQFTGLKDHKGREIYEGDIVEILPRFSAKQGLKRKFHLFAVVRWDERLARFVVISKEILDSIPDSECVSVIGNVHDTPELLTLGGFEK